MPLVKIEMLSGKTPGIRLAGEEDSHEREVCRFRKIKVPIKVAI